MKMKKKTLNYGQGFVIMYVSSILLFFSIPIIIPCIVTAHSPTDMTVFYNIETRQVRLSITHTVNDATTHYIKTVTIKKNGMMYNTSTYTAQPTANTFIYSYQVNATTNDTIEVTASCNQGGSKTIQHTVAPTNGENKTSTPGFEILLIIGAILIFIVILRKKQVH